MKHFSLRINDIKVEDDYVYRCIVTTGDGSSASVSNEILSVYGELMCSFCLWLECLNDIFWRFLVFLNDSYYTCALLSFDS